MGKELRVWRELATIHRDTTEVQDREWEKDSLDPIYLQIVPSVLVLASLLEITEFRTTDTITCNACMTQLPKDKESHTLACAF